MDLKLKAQKEFELRVHDALYRNIQLLTLKYPPTKDFQAVFKEDMFLKNNKAAFQEVIYYLLNVLDSKKLKEKVPTWPLFEAKLEVQFRKEIIDYINEINNHYEDANIPPLVTSHLISPGGFKFIKFMHKLSQLVMREHLKRNRNNDEMLLPVKPSKNPEITSDILNNVAIASGQIQADIQKMKISNEANVNAAKCSAAELKDKHKEVDAIIEKYTGKIETLLVAAKGTDVDPTDNSKETLQFRKNIEIMEGYQQILGKSSDIFNCLKTLTPNSDLQEQVNMFKLFGNFNDYISQQLLVTKPLNQPHLEDQNADLTEALQHGTDVDKDYCEMLSKVKDAMTKIMKIPE